MTLVWSGANHREAELNQRTIGTNTRFEIEIEVTDLEKAYAHSSRFAEAGAEFLYLASTLLLKMRDFNVKRVMHFSWLPFARQLHPPQPIRGRNEWNQSVPQTARYQPLISGNNKKTGALHHSQLTLASFVPAVASVPAVPHARPVTPPLPGEYDPCNPEMALDPAAATAENDLCDPNYSF